MKPWNNDAIPGLLPETCPDRCIEWRTSSEAQQNWVKPCSMTEQQPNVQAFQNISKCVKRAVKYDAKGCW